jgi:CzcA family heavy metal efflux pump
VSVARWAHRHARSILFLLAALVVCGVFATLVVPVSLFPRVNFPRIRVNVEAGDRPAERMAVEVTRSIEESLRAMPGVRGVRSVSSRGSAEIWVGFDWGEDMTAALLQAESQVNKVVPTLPAGTTFEVRRMDPTVFPVIAYSLTSPTRPLTELYDLAQFQLRPVLSTIPGVARIGVTGGAVQEYRVVVDPAKLAARGLALSDVATALSTSNVLTAVGQIEDRYKLLLVIADTRFKNIGEIGDTVIRAGGSVGGGASGSGGGIIKLSDVATVRVDAAPQFRRVTADGRDAVQIDVFQQLGGNTVDIAAGIRDALAAEARRLPSDVHITNWYDQSELITASAHSVRDAVLIGVALAALVLLLFLRNWRMTLIAALAVPIVLGVTALLLYLLGQSFNIMTLGGMAAAVGLIIDDAIVMAEHIVRRLHTASVERAGRTIGADGERIDAESRILAATDEFTKPLVGSSLSTILIHIPPAFLIGVTGAFFAALSLSMASALVISFFVAWLAIPILAARLLRRQDVAHHTPGESDRRRVYPAMMRRVLGFPWLVLLLIVPLLAVGYLAYNRLASGFMPALDEGGFVIDYVAPPGTSLTEADRMLRKVESILHHTAEVDATSRRTGFALGEDLAEANNGDIFVHLKPLPRRPIDEVMDDVRKEIEHEVPGLEVELLQLTEDLIGDLTGQPEPVVVNLFSEDESQLAALAEKVAEAVAKVPDVVEVKSGIVPAGDALTIEVDRVKASLEGVDPEAITKSLQDLLSGNVTTQIQQGEKLIDVRVWIPAAARRTVRDVEELQLRAPDGHLFPLKRVAALHIVTGQPEITREDLKRVVSVTGRSNRDLGSTIRDVREVLDRPGLLPPGVRYTLGGLYEQQQIAFRGLVLVMAAGAALVFLLLLFLYESFRVAIAIMITTALAMAAVFIGLWVTGTELNVSSLMGMVMIVGNVTEVAIFYFSEYADFPHAGDTRDRLIAAGSFRMRAITMTTVAAILALLPLALGVGQGSAMLQPLAIAIIAGLLVQLPLVLIVFPALLALMRMDSRGAGVAVTAQRRHPA